MAAAPSAPTRKAKEDVEALLSDLDNLDPAQNGAGVAAAANESRSKTQQTNKVDDAQSLLDDLDDLVKRRTPTPKKLSILSTPSSVAKTETAKQTTSTTNAAPTSTSTATMGAQEVPVETDVALHDSLGDAARADPPAQPSWGTWWSSATKLADQARAELEKRAAQVQSQVAESTGEAGGSGSTTAAPWAIAQNVNSFLKNNRDLNKLRSDLSKAGIKGWNELLNVVVPPIEQHEILSITLSHGE